jgi:hypothetical protein
MVGTPYQQSKGQPITGYILKVNTMENEFIYCPRLNKLLTFSQAKEVLNMHPVQLWLHPGYINVPWVGCN